MQNNLILNKISCEKEKIDYVKFSNLINPNNPFYKIELLDITTENILYYFVFEVLGEPKILMPFYLRNIPINSMKPYKDVISPYGYSGPLYNKSTADVIIIQFWEEVTKWYKKNDVISEFIRFNLDGNHTHYNGEIRPTLNNVRGEIIPDEKEQWDNLKSKVRNNYRKAKESNLICEIYENEIAKEKIIEFYDIYIATMNRNKATEGYFFSFDYFFNFITKNESSRILVLIFRDGIPISVELVLKSDETLYSFLGGTNSDYFQYRPNDFLKIEVLNWARLNNFKYYVLGGGRENNDNLYKYKKTFFHKDEDLIYYTGRNIIDEKVYAELCLLRNKKNEQDTNFFPLYRS